MMERKISYTSPHFLSTQLRRERERELKERRNIRAFSPCYFREKDKFRALANKHIIKCETKDLFLHTFTDEIRYFTALCVTGR